jgi:hypothetical protein
MIFSYSLLFIQCISYEEVSVIRCVLFLKKRLYIRYTLKKKRRELENGCGSKEIAVFHKRNGREI